MVPLPLLVNCHGEHLTEGFLRISEILLFNVVQIEWAIIYSHFQLSVFH